MHDGVVDLSQTNTFTTKKNLFKLRQIYLFSMAENYLIQCQAHSKCN